MSAPQYAEIVAQCEVNRPSKVREWITPDGITHKATHDIHPMALMTAWAADGWRLVTVTTYFNLRIYTLYRPAQ